MKTKILALALLFSITIGAQITKTEAFTIGTKLAFYPNQCGNTIPEAMGKLTFCDRANNLGVVERSYGLNDRGVNEMLPNHFNEDEFYVTRNGLSIRNTDGTWDNIPNIAIPLWGSQNLPTIKTGLVLPNGNVIIQATNAGYLFNVYDRDLKTFTAVDFPNNRYPQQMVYDQDRNLTWAFAKSGNTTYLFKYNEASNVLTEVADLGAMSIGGNSINVIYKDDFIYLGNTNGLYKMDISDYENSVSVTHYDSTTTPGLPFNRVGDLQFDTNNDLWMANNDNNDGGIVKFNILNETYTTFQTPRPDNAAINIKFNKLAIDDSGVIWAVGNNYSGLIKLTVENSSPTWTLLPKDDLTTLGVPITYNPNNIYFQSNKFYFTITDFSSGSNSNFEVIINDNDVWSGRNDNEEGNLSRRMNRRFTKNMPDDNGGVWWFNRFDDIIVYRDADDNHQSILIDNIGFTAVVDDDYKAIVKGGSPNELRKIDFPNTYSIQDGNNQADDIKRVADQIWVFDRGDKKIDVYKDDVLINTYNLDEDWYENAFYFAVDNDGDAWFMRYASDLEIKKFDTSTLTSTTYDLSALGSLGSLRKVTAAPNGGVWFVCNLGMIYQEGGVFYDFKTADYPEIFGIGDVIVDTNGKAYVLTNNISITTIENPTDTNPILETTILHSTNAIMPSLDHNGPSSIAIDSEGSVWTHASQNTFKLIDADLATEYLALPTLSTTDYELGSIVNIYPNPTKNNIHINFKQDGDYSFSVYNISGQEIFQQEKMEVSNTFDFSKYASGLYILKIKDETNNTFQNIKIVKM
jgi:streptogramin lyase